MSGSLRSDWSSLLGGASSSGQASRSRPTGDDDLGALTLEPYPGSVNAEGWKSTAPVSTPQWAAFEPFHAIGKKVKDKSSEKVILPGSICKFCGYQTKVEFNAEKVRIHIFGKDACATGGVGAIPICTKSLDRITTHHSDLVGHLSATIESIKKTRRNEGRDETTGQPLKKAKTNEENMRMHLTEAQIANKEATIAFVEWLADKSIPVNAIAPDDRKNSSFIKFLKALKDAPGWEVPQRKDMGCKDGALGPALQLALEKSDQRMSFVLSKTSDIRRGGIETDSVTVNRTSFANTVMSVPGLGTIHLSGSQFRDKGATQNAKYYGRLLVADIRELRRLKAKASGKPEPDLEAQDADDDLEMEAEPGAPTVATIVVDGALEAIIRLLAEHEDPDVACVITTLCVVHGLNLLLKDLYAKVKLFKQCLDHAAELIRFILKHTKLFVTFKGVPDSRALFVCAPTRHGGKFLEGSSVLRNMKQIAATLTDEDVNTWISVGKPGYAHRGKVLAMRTLINTSMYQVRSESANEAGVNFEGAQMTFSEQLLFTEEFVKDIMLLMRLADTPGPTAPHIAYGIKQVEKSIEAKMRLNPNKCPPEMVATVKDILKNRIEKRVYTPVVVCASAMNPAYLLDAVTRMGFTPHKDIPLCVEIVFKTIAQFYKYIRNEETREMTIRRAQEQYIQWKEGMLPVQQAGHHQYKQLRDKGEESHLSFDRIRKIADRHDSIEMFSKEIKTSLGAVASYWEQMHTVSELQTFALVMTNSGCSQSESERGHKATKDMFSKRRNRLKADVVEAWSKIRSNVKAKQSTAAQVKGLSTMAKIMLAMELRGRRRNLALEAEAAIKESREAMAALASIDDDVILDDEEEGLEDGEGEEDFIEAGRRAWNPILDEDDEHWVEGMAYDRDSLCDDARQFLLDELKALDS